MSLPPLLSRTDELTRALLANGREVDAGHREGLQRHLDRLNLWFRGAEDEDIVPEVSVLRSVMSRSQTTSRQEESALDAYCAVLRELPPWAITRACKDYLTGRAGDGRFAPTPAEIATRCRVLMARYIEDRAKIERALGIAAKPAKEPWEEDCA